MAKEHGSMDRWNIREGTEVRSADDEKLVKVVAIEGNFLVVEKGFFFPTDYYIPTSAISTVNDEKIFLSVGKEQALNSGWDQIASTDTLIEETTRAGITGMTTTPDDVLSMPAHTEDLTRTMPETPQPPIDADPDEPARV
jgi:hypothetical protein